MREIKFQARATRLTKYTVDALAWATNRRGHNKWQGTNVVDVIYSYLVQHNVDLSSKTARGPEEDSRAVNDVLFINPHNLTYTMKRLEKEGYATLTVTGKRFTSFEFKPDVILTGHSVRFVKSGEPAPVGPVAADYADALDKGTSNADIPLPTVPHVRYHRDELNEMLDRWSEKDPEAYGDYVEKLEDVLRALL